MASASRSYAFSPAMALRWVVVLSQVSQGIEPVLCSTWLTHLVPSSYGASVTNVFGPLIIKSFGFDSRKTILLNIPFGFMQMSCILGLAFVATKLSRKSISLGILVVPCIIDASLLYAIVRNKANTGVLLFGY